MLEEVYGLKVGAIFSGKDKGNFSYIQSLVDKFNLQDRVRFVGFLANEDLLAFYQQSLALVMPSYFWSN